jgi:hypothetical protein
MTYSRKAGGRDKTSVLNETVPRVEQDAHLRFIGCMRICFGLTRMRSAHCVTWALKAAMAAAFNTSPLPSPRLARIK